MTQAGMWFSQNWRRKKKHNLDDAATVTAIVLSSEISDEKDEKDGTYGADE